MESDAQLLRMRDVLQRLRLSRPTIYRLIDNGQLEALHIGRALRITARSVAAFIELQIEAENDAPTGIGDA